MDTEPMTERENLLAHVASVICEETCGLTSECKSREAARALYEKGLLAARTDAGYGAGFEACREAAIAIVADRNINDSVAGMVSAIAALAAPGGNATGWQPIETAPKGKGLIDVWTVGWGAEPHRVADCYYDSICDEWRTSRPTGQLICVKARYVTNWQPLPPPPTITRKSKSEERV